MRIDFMIAYILRAYAEKECKRGDSCSLKYTIGWWFWRSTAPIPVVEASVWISNGELKSGSLSMGVCIGVCFKSWNAFVAVGVQMKVFLPRSFVNEAEMDA